MIGKLDETEWRPGGISGAAWKEVLDLIGLAGLNEGQAQKLS